MRNSVASLVVMVHRAAMASGLAIAGQSKQGHELTAIPRRRQR